MTVDVVLPIYNAFDDLVRCIDSVVHCTDGDYRLLLINDASPDVRIAPFLSQIAVQHPHV
jgi:glycosyltransferase involved in cell wall biosynthesis